MANDTKDKYSVSYRSGRTVDKKKKKKKEMTESEKMPHGMYAVKREASTLIRRSQPKKYKSKQWAYIANSLDSYKKAFRSMRNKYGDNAKFEWRGKTYTTKLKK